MPPQKEVLQLPVAKDCTKGLPTKPALRTFTMKKTDSLDVQVVKALSDVIELNDYSSKLEAVVDGCK